MIGYIKGKVIDIEPNYITLENNGIGYEIYCSGSAFSKLSSAKEGEVYTYLQVKEDGLSLYGFSSKEEKSMFLKLISVSGVGPKMGICVLSSLSLIDVASAIANSDTKTLSSVKGLGKKTAERIILELREKISLIPLTDSGVVKETYSTDQNDEDVIIALMNLGFNRNESINSIKMARQNGAVTVQDTIMFALRSL